MTWRQRLTVTSNIKHVLRQRLTAMDSALVLRQRLTGAQMTKAKAYKMKHWKVFGEGTHCSRAFGFRILKKQKFHNHPGSNTCLTNRTLM